MTGKRYTHRPAVAILFNIIQVGLLVLMPLLTPFLPVTIAEVEARSLQDTNIVAPDGEPAPRPDPVGLQPAPTRGEALQTANVTMVQSVDTGDAGPGNVYNGDWITFTLLITNVESSQPITGVTFVNILEEGAFNESTLHCDPDCEPQWITQTIPEPSGGTVVVSKTESLLWDIGQLASGSSAEVSFSGQVIGQAEGSTLINLASAAYEIEGNQRAVAADDIVLTALLRIPEGGGEATISSAPTWFSEDAGGTISQDWGDFDRDGDLDLVLGSSLGASVYRNDEGTLNLIWASPEGRLAYGVRWANVVTDSSSLELVVVGDSVDKTAQSEGLNYIYAFDAGRTEFIETGVFTSHLQLVRLAPADYDGDGYVDIVASTNAINGREWVGSQQLCPVNLYRNDGTGHFTGTVTSKPGIDVVCVQETATAALGVGDVDGDGDPDLIVGDFPSTVKVLFNSASDPQVGSPFTRAETIERGLEYIPYDLAWGDYDGDGVLEVAAAFPLQREAHVYKYQPDQQSNPRLLLSHIIRTDAFMTPLSVDWGDFNGDGQLDLVVADSPPRFYEYTGQNFEPISSLNLPPSVIRGQIWSLRGIALNTRRNLDLVLANRDGSSEIFTVLAPRLNRALHEVGNGEEASSVAWGDADGDGDLDLLFGGTFFVLSGKQAYSYLNRDGQFVDEPKVFKFSGYGPHAMAYGDVDKDGILDVAVGTPTKLQIYQPQLFQNDYYNREPWKIDTNNPVRSLAWADANDDSALDLLVGYADGLIELYLNSGTRLNTTPAFTATEAGAIQSLAWADYDNDYYLDFVVAVDNGRTTIYHNDGYNHYSRAWWTPESAPYRAVAWGDYDADGYPDLAIGVYGAPDTVWQNENGRFGSEPVWRSEDLPPNRTTSLAWGDWDNDGYPELALGHDGAQDVVYANLRGQLVKLWESSASAATTGVAWGDRDQDGDLDLAVSHQGSNAGVGYYENNLATPVHLPTVDTLGRLDDPPYLYVERPGTTEDGYYYSSPQILAGPSPLSSTRFITVHYTLHDPEADPLAATFFEYSLDGGTTWEEATPAPHSAPPTTATSVAGTPATFVWDAAADDAVSDNARFRIRVGSSNDVGPLQDIAGSAVSPPFRVRALDCFWPAGAWITATVLEEKRDVLINEEVIFEGRVTTANGPLRYEWDFGDGTTAVGWQAPHAFVTNGTYTVTLKVTGQACPLARPAYAVVTIDVVGSLTYLPLVVRNYTETPDQLSTPPPAPAGPHGGSYLNGPPTVESIPPVRAFPPRSFATESLSAQSLMPEAVRVTRLRDGVSHQPAINAYGTRLAFWSTSKLEQNADGSIEIFVATIDDDGNIVGNPTQVTSSTGSILGGFNLAPAIDRDGNRIVFFSDRDYTEENDNADHNFEIFLAGVAGSTVDLVQITKTPAGVNILPDISPDGRFLTFASNNDLINGGMLEHVEIYRAEIGARSAPTASYPITFTRVTHTTGTGYKVNDEPSISEDGRYIAFVSNHSHDSSSSTDTARQIFRAEILPNGQIEYLQITDDGAGGTNAQPSISASGEQIVYVGAPDPNTPRQVYVAKIAPSGSVAVEQKTVSAGNKDNPTINAEGTRIAYYSDDDGQVWLQDLIDESSRNLGLETFYPSLSANGVTLAYAYRGNIYLNRYPLTDLGVHKLSSSSAISAGNELSYTLTFTNNGPSPATKAILVDRLPPGLLATTLSDPVNYTHTLLLTTASNPLNLPESTSASHETWTDMASNELLWPMDNSPNIPDNVFPDVSGYLRDGTCSPAETCPTTVSGKFGDAAHFDGNDYLTPSGTEVPFNGRSFTIAFWAKRQDSGRYEYIVHRSDYSYYWYSELWIGFEGAKFVFGAESWGDYAVVETEPYYDTEWHHWVCTYDINRLAIIIYRDGVEVAQERMYPYWYWTSETFEVGRGYGDYFLGDLDEFAIFSRALSASEVAHLYTLQAPPWANKIESAFVLTDTSSADYWGMLSWIPERVIGEPLPDNGGRDEGYPVTTKGRVDMGELENVLLLHLDESGGSGSFIDTSGWANDGKCTRCPQTHGDGIFGTSLHFDGNDDYLEVRPFDNPASLLLTDTFTLEAWVHPTGNGSGYYDYFLAKESAFYLRRRHQGHLEWCIRYLSSGSPYCHEEQDFSLPTDTWTHVALVYNQTQNGNYVTTFRNGSLFAGSSVPYPPHPSQSTTVEVGGRSYGYAFKGWMDEVAIYKTALTSTEIRDHYLRGLADIAFQVRACPDPDCNNVPFEGPQGRGSTYRAIDDVQSRRPTFALRGVEGRYAQLRAFPMDYSDNGDLFPMNITVTLRPQVSYTTTNYSTVNPTTTQQVITWTIGTPDAPLPVNEPLAITLGTTVTLGTYGNQFSSFITNTATVASLAESDHVTKNNSYSTTTYLLPIPIKGVELTCPQSTGIMSATSVLAEATPSWASPNVTYTWTATDYPTPVMTHGDLDETYVYTWTQSGTKTVTVTAENEISPVYSDTCQIEVIPPALVIRKSGPASRQAGQNIRYTLGITNTDGPALGVVITDTLPTGANFVEASPGGSLIPGSDVVSWYLSYLPSGAERWRTFTVTATQTITNEHYGVRSNNGGTASGTDVVTTVIDPILSITKSGPATATVDSEITYTLAVTNSGGLAQGVVITDQLPTGANFVRATGNISPSGGVLTWNIGPLAYNESTTRAFAVTASQTITNEHYGVDANNSEAVPGAPAVVTTIAPELSITKDGLSVATVGTVIPYTLTVTNSGGPASGVVVTDALPLDATFVAASDGGSLITATNVVTWMVGGLNTNATQTLTFTVVASQTITNDDYWVIPEGGDPVPGTPPVTTVISPSLSITKSGPPTATAGTDFVYTLTVTNTGGLATGVVITDVLPTGAHFSSASPSGGDLGGVVVWNQLPSIPANDSIFVTLTVTATQSVTNADYAVTANYTTPVTGSVAVSTIVTPSLSIGKSGPPTATAGTDFVYTLTVTNTGGLATGVIITDVLPTGAFFKAAANDGAETSPGSREVVWNSSLPTLPFNGSLWVTLTVTATQSVTNADYVVIADGAVPVSGSAVSTLIAPSLVITKSAPYSFTAGNEITFTLRVTNTGGLATGVVITDVLPSLATFLRASEGITPFGELLTWTVTQPLSYTRYITRSFTVTASQTITNERYGVRATGGYTAPIPLPVVVRLE